MIMKKSSNNSINLFGTSMISGFQNVSEIPPACLDHISQVNSDPLLSLPKALAMHGVKTNVCAAPGLSVSEVNTWFDAVPQWHDLPTVFWFGRNRQNIDQVVFELANMVRHLSSWWVCPIPKVETDQGQSFYDDLNSELRDFAGDRFLDPVSAISGRDVLPRNMRLDRVHPNCNTNKKIADYLIGQTLGQLVSRELEYV